MLPSVIESEELASVLAAWASEVDSQSFEEPLMSLAPLVYKDFDSHFMNAQGPDGPWAPRKHSYPNPILIKSGKLIYAAATKDGAGTILRYREGALEFGVDGSVVNYAGFHEYGTQFMPARPWAYLSENAIEEVAVKLLDALFLLLIGD